MDRLSCLPTVLALLLAATSPAYSQGDLTPPGAPAPSMKTLDQVEARTPLVDSSPGVSVNASTGAITISASGSYYLTGNQSSSGDGISISISNVTVDLNGFTITGSSTSSSLEGVTVRGTATEPLTNVEVKNGNIVGFGNSVEVENGINCSLDHLRCSGSASTGIYLQGSGGKSNGNKLTSCSVFDANGTGIHLRGTTGECNGNMLVNCSVNGSTNIGISLEGSTGKCNGNTFVNCSVNDSGSSGILMNATSGECNGNKLAQCSVSETESYGIYLAGGASGNTILDCTISYGIDRGILVSGGATLKCIGNVFLRNQISNISGLGSQVAGISLNFADHNRVESNQISQIVATSGQTTYGILCLGEQNLILKNSCFGASDNFSISNFNTFGPEVSASGILSNTNPWANFSLN